MIKRNSSFPELYSKILWPAIEKIQGQNTLCFCRVDFPRRSKHDLILKVSSTSIDAKTIPNDNENKHSTLERRCEDKTSTTAITRCGSFLFVNGHLPVDIALMSFFIGRRKLRRSSSSRNASFLLFSLIADAAPAVTTHIDV